MLANVSVSPRAWSVAGALVWLAAGAAPVAAEKAEGPYMVVTSETDGPDPLPLELTRADIDIAGVIAHVRVTQVYRNRGTSPLEAVYVFPGSTRSAVFGMRMIVGDRVIEAGIQQKQVARQMYEAAKEDGKTASLLEQHRPNVFQMSVANVLPGDRVEVQLDYTELIVPTDGIYELVYPAVVGPRYTGEQKAREDWHRNPYLSEGKPEPYGFELKARLAAGMGIHQLASPSHGVKPSFVSASEARLEVAGAGAGTKDFVLRYQLRGGAIQTGLLRHAGDDESFFLLMVQPPAQVARDTMPAREYVFIVDVSGSMAGFPLDVSKKIMRRLLGDLRPQDRFNILFFAGSNYALSERSVPATPENVARAMEVVDQRSGGGGTELLGALRRALAMKAAEGMSRTFVALTDGYVSVEAEAARLIRENLGHANFFAFGIGSSVNRHLIESLARAGMGEPFIVLDQTQATREARRFHEMVSRPALTDIAVRYDGFDVYDVEPHAPPDLLAERPLLVFGKYRGNGAGTITVTGRTGRGLFRQKLDVGSAAPAAQNRALRFLWARHRVATLSDLESFGEPAEQAITELGLRYGLMTKYTSFVAIDKERRNPGGQQDTIKQPLPLPAGVPSSAISSGASMVSVDDDELDLIRIEGSAPLLEPGRTYDASIDIVLRSMSVAFRADEELRSGAFTAAAVPRNTLVFDHALSFAFRQGGDAATLPTLVRYGVTRRLEARLGSSLSLIDGEARMPDLGFGAKLELWRWWRYGAISLLVDGVRDFDGDEPLAWRLRELLLGDAYFPCLELHLRANLGAQMQIFDEADGRAAFVFGTELSYSGHGRVLPFAGTSGAFGGGASDLGIDAGVSVRVTDELRAGVSTRTGLTGDADDFRAGVFLRWGL